MTVDLTDAERAVLERWREIKGWGLAAGPLPRPTVEEAIDLGMTEEEAREYVADYDPESARKDHEQNLVWVSALDKVLGPRTNPLDDLSDARNAQLNRQHPDTVSHP